MALAAQVKKPKITVGIMDWQVIGIVRLAGNPCRSAEM
jgi:hypothetical protein